MPAHCSPEKRDLRGRRVAVPVAVPVEPIAAFAELPDVNVGMRQVPVPPPASRSPESTEPVGSTVPDSDQESGDDPDR